MPLFFLENIKLSYIIILQIAEFRIYTCHLCKYQQINGAWDRHNIQTYTVLNNPLIYVYIYKTILNNIVINKQFQDSIGT
jgi:hypothetical protein